MVWCVCVVTMGNWAVKQETSDIHWWSLSCAIDVVALNLLFSVGCIVVQSRLLHSQVSFG